MKWIMLIGCPTLLLSLSARELSQEDALLAASLYQTASTIADPDFIDGPDVEIEPHCVGCEDDKGVLMLRSNQRFDLSFSMSTTRGARRETDDSRISSRIGWNNFRIIREAACMSESERNAYFGEVCQQIDRDAQSPQEAIEAKVAIAQALGSSLNGVYDYEIANDGVKKVVDSSDQYAAICNNLSGDEHQVAGVCRHAALTIAEYLNACGFDKSKIRIPGYATQIGGHMIVALSTPYGIYTINWAEAIRSDTSDGSYELDSRMLPEVGPAIAWYDYDGNFIGNQYTAQGIMLDNVFNDGGFSGAKPENYTEASVELYDKKLNLTTEVKFFANTSDELNMSGVATIVTYKPERGFYGHLGLAAASGEVRTDIDQQLLGYDIVAGVDYSDMNFENTPFFIGLGGEIHVMGTVHKTGENADRYALSNPANEISAWASIMWEIQEKSETSVGHNLEVSADFESQFGLDNAVEQERGRGKVGFGPGLAPVDVAVATQYLFEAPDGHYLVADLHYDNDSGMSTNTAGGFLEVGKDETNINIGMTTTYYEYDDLRLTTLEIGSTIGIKKDTVYFDLAIEAPLEEGSVPGGSVSMTFKY